MLTPWEWASLARGEVSRIRGVCLSRVFAWGPGHDHVNELTLKVLPRELREALWEDTRRHVVEWSHKPDDFTPWRKLKYHGGGVGRAGVRVHAQPGHEGGVAEAEMLAPELVPGAAR